MPPYSRSGVSAEVKSSVRVETAVVNADSNCWRAPAVKPWYVRSKTEKLAVGIREAAHMLSVSPRTIQNYIAAKLLPARKIGRRTVIPVRALEAFLRTDHASPLPRTDHAPVAQ